ncbi:MAG TPA: fused MFS/spermidine synthase, partial [Rhizobiaceae bacterium]
MTAEANLATRVAANRAARTNGHSAILLACACFMLGSGFASLVYQVTWVRLLGLGLGSTSASISIVVSSFFLGMSLGSYFFDRIANTRAGELKAYAALELCIGICGLLLLPVLLNLDYLLSFAPAVGTQPVLKLFVTLALLIVPTTCMGATFPVIASLLAGTDARLGRLISQLYSLNTFGAVAGAVLSGFVLIPNLGLDGTIYVAAAVNILIGIAALMLAAPRKSTGYLAAVPVELAPDLSHRQHAGWNGAAALTLAVTGFASIATQVGWTKYLAVFVGSTIYGLAAILSIFLAGIALGAWLIRPWIDRAKSSEALLALGLLAAGIALMATRAGLAYLPELQRLLNGAEVGPGTMAAVRYLALVFLILPPTLLFGALFPLNLKVFCGGVSGVRTLVGKAYALNTLASIAGAAFAGFVAIPQFGTDKLLLAMAVLVAATALVWIGRAAVDTRRVQLGFLGMLAVGAALVFPGLDYRQLIATVGYDYYSKTGEVPEYLFLKEGKAGVIGLLSYDGDKVKLQNNGLNEAQLTQSNPNDVPLIESLLGFIPYALHKGPSSAFVVGFGGGTTTRILADTDLREIRVVELEPAIVEAGRFIKGGPVSALSDPRVKISFNDARNVLLVEDRKYDLIVSQPSHPWLAGTSGVFSREFWEITRSRLNEGGVFAQWVNLVRMDVPTLKSLLKSFFSVYPEGMVFANSSNIVMVGSVDPLTFDAARFNSLMATPALKEKFGANGVRDVNDVLWYFSLSRDQAVWASDDEVASTDTNVLAEVRLSKLIDAPEGEDSPSAFLESRSTLDVGKYLGGDAGNKLALLAMYFLREEAYWRADLAIAQVEKMDARLGRTLRHRRAMEMLDFATATDLYYRYPSWPSDVHLAQARAMMELGAYGEARAALDRANVVDAQIDRQRLAYLEGAFVAGVADSIWSLVARADSGDRDAEEMVVAQAERGDLPDDVRLYADRILLRHFAAGRDDRELQKKS